MRMERFEICVETTTGDWISMVMQWKQNTKIIAYLEMFENMGLKMNIAKAKHKGISDEVLKNV